MTADLVVINIVINIPFQDISVNGAATQQSGGVDYAYLSAYWTKMAALAGSISALAATAYAALFFWLQRQINNFYIKGAERARLIQLSTQWNSVEFVECRNYAYLTISRFEGNKAKLYDILVEKGRERDWIDISAVAHFIETIGKLTLDGQLNVDDVRAEFGSTIHFWTSLLIPVFIDFSVESPMLRLLEVARQRLGERP